MGVFVAVGFLFINGCDTVHQIESNFVQHLQNKKVITVLILNHPILYSKSKELHKGFDTELINHFSKEYDLNIKFVVKDKKSEIITGMERNEADMAIARFREDEINKKNWLVSVPIENTNWGLYCGKKVSKKVIAKRSIYLTEDARPALQKEFKKLAQNNSTFITKSPKAALQMVGKNNCAIVDSLFGDHELTLNSDLRRHPLATNETPVVWMFQQKNSELATLTSRWLQKNKQSDFFEQVTFRYHDRLKVLKADDVARFHSRIKNYLSLYKEDFKNSAKTYGVDWRLVAAVAYQESQWNPQAKSFTGVQGIMQITRQTAEHLGVENPLDPSQSIWGGTLYLKKLIERFSKLPDPYEQVAFALASYNSGIAHLFDARHLALSKGHDPNTWTDLKKVYPLLADVEIAKHLKYGLARGHETVDFVERVLAYYSILKELS